MPADGNAPGLAFSIFDEESGPEYEDNYSYPMIDRSDYGYADVEQAEVGEMGDRGNVVVDIPAQVLPYMPRAIQRSLNVEAAQNKLPGRGDSKRQGGEPGNNSADFHSFQTVAGGRDGLNIRKVHDIRLTSEQLQSDGPLLLSVGSSLSYGANQRPGVRTESFWQFSSF